MKEKHFLTATILLLLPLSFGVGTSAGVRSTDTLNVTDVGHSQALKKTTQAVHGFTAKDIARGLVAIPSGYAADVGHPVETFVSSFDPALTSETMTQGAANSAIAFPIYDAFSGSDTAEYSHSAATVGLFGGGPGGGGGGPVGSRPANPDVPIATPEPGTVALLVFGLFSLAMLGRRKVLCSPVRSN